MSAMTPAERKRLERQADNLSSNTAIFAPVQYNYPAPSHDASGIAAQDYAFVQELQRRAVPPATSDVVRRAAHDLWKNSSKSALAVQIPELVFDPPTFDVHVVRNSEDLSKVLRRPFSFIFIPRSSGLVNTHGWTIEKQVAALGAGKGQAYQPSKKTARGGQSTHNVGHSALKSFLDAESRKPEHSGINFLDICNPTKFYFPPAEVHSVSLVDQIRDYNFSESWGRGKAPERDRSDEWTILTGGPSSSPWHNDHGGQTTVVVGLEGEKIWHGVSGDWETARKRFYVNGFRGCNYPNGIFHITLGPGDCLIQNPGSPHAVVTPGNAMIAGCFLYTSALFARTIICIRLTAAQRLHPNEEMSNKEWSKLVLILRHIHRPGLFTDQQREKVHVEVGELLLQENVVSVSADTFKVNLSWKKSDRPKYAKATLEEVELLAQADGFRAFLWACYDWWSTRT